MFLRCPSSLSGLKQIHALSIQGNYELRIDLEDFENSTAYAQYGTFGVGLFSVDPDDDGYPLTVGDYSGNADQSKATCRLPLNYCQLITLLDLQRKQKCAAEMKQLFPEPLGTRRSKNAAEMGTNFPTSRGKAEWKEM
ncbi:hypothetical protein WMY93_021423 [Mugilogobius chulae]|uniref:Fibrinogen C-terminal domain-containing protein n=1 Tax=Mugilogobius chulae TaxID=88201 RepID=A0AAW0NHV0_9GOBI